MATLPKEYKIDKDVPFIRTSGHEFDKTQPEYIIMVKLKVGESFEFPRNRVKNVHNTRIYFRKKGLPLCFMHTSRDVIKKNPKMLTGRCWRLKDGTFKKHGPIKNRPKGAAINLKEVKE